MSENNYRLGASDTNHYKVHHSTNVTHVEIMQVVAVESRLGRGTDDDPVRIITEYYDMDGVLLARIDNYGTRDGEGP